MIYHVVPLMTALYVEGRSDSTAVGEFCGNAIAMGLRITDPVAPEGEAVQTPEEGLLGWGTTHLLVSDPGKQAPVWVLKGDVTYHRLNDRGLRRGILRGARRMQGWLATRRA